MCDLPLIPRYPAGMTGPTIRRRVLGKEIRALRDAAGISREEVATLLGCSPTKVTYLESGRNVIGKTELIVYTQHLGVEDRLDALEELRQDANQRGWWSTARLPEWLAAYVGLEDDATSVRAFELALIPGLLQTEQYARDLHTLRGELADKDVERRVAARMHRQRRLTGSNPLTLTAIVCESALRHCLRYPAGGREQLQHLLDQAERPNIELRMLPEGLHPGMSGAFSLLSFPGDLLPDVAWQEYAMGGHIIDDTSAVNSLTRLHRELCGQALGVNESLAVIAELIDHTPSPARRGINEG